MLIWQGLGAYAFVVPFAVWFALQILAHNVVGPTGPELYGQLLGGVALSISAALVWLLARRFDSRPGWEVIDKATGAEVTIRDKHTLFFLPMRFWAIVYAIAGVILLVLAVVNGLT